MFYQLIPLIASIALALYHAVVSEASRGEKIAVAAVVGLATLLWWRGLVLATVIQSAISIYVLIRIRIETADA